MRKACDCQYCKQNIDEYSCMNCQYKFNECDSFHEVDGFFLCPVCHPKDDKELLSITDMVQHPTVARKFKFGTKGEYWTGEDYEEDDTLAWLVYMQYAHTYTDDKCETAQVRCVRDHR